MNLDFGDSYHEHVFLSLLFVLLVCHATGRRNDADALQNACNAGCGDIFADLTVGVERVEVHDRSREPAPVRLKSGERRFAVERAGAFPLDGDRPLVHRHIDKLPLHVRKTLPHEADDAQIPFRTVERCGRNRGLECRRFRDELAPQLKVVRVDALLEEAHRLFSFTFTRFCNPCV